jgi:acetyl esterase/lipase
MNTRAIKAGTLLLASIVMGCGPSPRQAAAAAASPQQIPGQPGGKPMEIALWPQGLAITKPELLKPDTDGTERSGTVDKPVAGRPWTYVGNAWRPTMTLYPPRGQNTHAAIMVYPGGGYQVLAIDLEGSEICDWATALGMTCVVLKYRVPQTWWHKDCGKGRGCQRQPVPFLPLQDAQRAMGLLRQRAAGLGVDPHKIGVIGFSAGGHLVTAISNATGRSYTPMDSADTLSARPDFAMPLYPGHLWTGQGLDLFPFDPVRADCPPTFMVQAEDDPVDDVRNSTSYFLALRAVKAPVEMHIFAHGGHAFGARPTAEPITHWPALAETWLHTIHIL